MLYPDPTSSSSAMFGDGYPRVVIASANPLRRDLPSGKLLSSLFEGWPAERLAQVSFPDGLSYLPEFDVCRQFSMIRASGRVRRMSAQTQDAAASLETPRSVARRGSSCGWRRQLLAQFTARQPLMNLLRVGQETWNAYSWIGYVFERELCHLRPEIVFADLGNFFMTRITCQACQRLGIPMYVHVGDDYMGSLYHDLPAGRILQELAERWLRRAVNYADGLQTASPLAADDLQRRYGGEWTWFTFPVRQDDHAPWLDQVPSRDVFRRAIVAALMQARMRHEPRMAGHRRTAA